MSNSDEEKLKWGGWEADKKRNKHTAGANETEQSINPNKIFSVCAIALQFFSVGSYVSLDASYKISLT